MVRVDPEVSVVALDEALAGTGFRLKADREGGAVITTAQPAQCSSREKMWRQRPSKRPHK